MPLGLSSLVVSELRDPKPHLEMHSFGLRVFDFMGVRVYGVRSRRPCKQ